MKQLKKAILKDNEVKTINAKSIEAAIKKAFVNDDYGFYLNSELIDVNNRFRIFSFKNKNYIVKKTTIEDGKDEVFKASKAYDYIDNIKINNFTLKVIQPQLVEIDKDAYIVTEYMGVSLQECVYSEKEKNLIDIYILFDILDKFLSLGILYRGFLPRNTVVKDNIIYLLDWEDTIFVPKNDMIHIHKLWETNFLLNWSYFFDLDILKEKIKEYQHPLGEEPKLLKYEIKFGNWINYNGNDIELRNKILDTVLFAERKLDVSDNDFCIAPNDLAHLVSDLFNSDIDVLFDISCKVMRNKNEQTYFSLIKMLSNLIVDLFKNKKAIQPYAILLILVIFTIAIKDLQAENMQLENYENIDEYIKYINKLNIKLTNNYFRHEKEMFKHELSLVLTNLISQFNEQDTKLNVSLDNITDYIFSIKKEEKNMNVNPLLYENEYFIVKQSEEFSCVPGFYTIMEKGKSWDNSLETIANLAKLEKCIRDTLFKLGIELVGIYKEQYLDNKFRVLIIPYHVDVLLKLNISPDEYQPHITRYLNSFDVSFKEMSDKINIKIITALNNLEEDRM